MVKFYKKAQSLPLNTIVIALLVVIVLVVIVLAFTSNIGSANETISENSASNLCSVENVAIGGLGYTNTREVTIPSGSTEIPSCTDTEDEFVVLRNVETQGEGDSRTYSGTICCASR